jgi:hypothetical protein
MIEEKQILHDTHYGLNIYAHILVKYYPDDIVLELSYKTCKPTRNPFNENKVTLNIFNEDWIFYFEDTEMPDFKGNPFDFAARHYNLSDEALMQKLNEELNLHIGENRNFYNNKPNMWTELCSSVPVLEFSFFRCPVTNTIPDKEMSLPEVYWLIKSNKYQQQTEELRAISDKVQARKFKAKKFDYATFSGTFSNRNDTALIQHSGLITLDFDHISNLPELKESLLRDKYFETELMFVSPSGDGLKWIISIDLKECNHQDWFNAIAAYIKATYQLEVDKSGKDISRACFLPHDSNIYINPNYLNCSISQSFKSKSHATK